MSDAELEQIIGKVRKLKALHRARENVKQLERELRGEPAKPGAAPLPAAGSWTIFPPHERSTSTV